MTEVLVDTDVFVDHLRGARELRRGDQAIAYSVITRAELLAGRAGEDEEAVATLLGPFRELRVDREVAERAGRLRREVEILLPDALIAATAIEHQLDLLTRNVHHFSAVPGLSVRAPG